MRNVHEYSVDRATSTAKIGSTNPIRKYLDADRPPVIVQLSHGELNFYDQGGQPMRIEDVPADILASLKRRRSAGATSRPSRSCASVPSARRTRTRSPAAATRRTWRSHIRKGALSAREVAEEPESFTADAGQVARAATRKAPAKRAGRKAKK